MSLIQLIAGLGNPGPEYAETRHNAGFWLLDALLQQANGTWVSQSKFFGAGEPVPNWFPVSSCVETNHFHE